MPTQARARRKVDAVLDACTQLLVREGYHRTTVLALSLESDVAVPTLYQYFDNKEAIFIAWVERSVDQVLAQVVQACGHMQGASLTGYVDVLVRVALQSVALLRPSMRSLLSEVPQVLSSQVAMTIETKTVAMIEDQFAAEIQKLAVQNLATRLHTLVRLMVGYFLLAILNDTRPLDVEKESDELSMVVKIYLENLGVSVVS